MFHKPEDVRKHAEMEACIRCAVESHSKSDPKRVGHFHRKLSEWFLFWNFPKCSATGEVDNIIIPRNSKSLEYVYSKVIEMSKSLENEKQPLIVHSADTRRFSLYGGGEPAFLKARAIQNAVAIVAITTVSHRSYLNMGYGEIPWLLHYKKNTYTIPTSSTNAAKNTLLTPITPIITPVNYQHLLNYPITIPAKDGILWSMTPQQPNLHSYLEALTLSLGGGQFVNATVSLSVKEVIAIRKINNAEIKNHEICTQAALVINGLIDATMRDKIGIQEAGVKADDQITAKKLREHLEHILIKGGLQQLTERVLLFVQDNNGNPIMYEYTWDQNTKGPIEILTPMLDAKNIPYWTTFASASNTNGGYIIATNVRWIHSCSRNKLTVRDMCTGGHLRNKYHLLALQDENRLGVSQGEESACWYNLIAGGTCRLTRADTGSPEAQRYLMLATIPQILALLYIEYNNLDGIKVEVVSLWERTVPYNNTSIHGMGHVTELQNQFTRNTAESRVCNLVLTLSRPENNRYFLWRLPQQMHDSLTQ